MAMSVAMHVAPGPHEEAAAPQYICGGPNTASSVLSEYQPPPQSTDPQLQGAVYAKDESLAGLPLQWDGSAAAEDYTIGPLDAESSTETTPSAVVTSQLPSEIAAQQQQCHNDGSPSSSSADQCAAAAAADCSTVDSLASASGSHASFMSSFDDRQFCSDHQAAAADAAYCSAVKTEDFGLDYHHHHHWAAETAAANAAAAALHHSAAMANAASQPHTGHHHTAAHALSLMPTHGGGQMMSNQDLVAASLAAARYHNASLVAAAAACDAPIGVVGYAGCEGLMSQRVSAFLAGPKERIHVFGRPVEHCPRCELQGFHNVAWQPHRHVGELKIRYICQRHFQDLDCVHHFDIPLCPLCGQVPYLYEFNSMLGMGSARRVHKYVLKCANRHVLPLIDLFCQAKRAGNRCNSNYKLQWTYGTMVKRCESQKNRDHDLWWVRYKNEWKQRRTIIRYKKDFLRHLADVQRAVLLGLGVEGEAPPDPKSMLGPTTYEALVSAVGGDARSAAVSFKRRRSEQHSAESMPLPLGSGGAAAAELATPLLDGQGVLSAKRHRGGVDGPSDDAYEGNYQWVL